MSIRLLSAPVAGGTSSTPTLQAVVNQGNTIQAGPTLIIRFTDGAGHTSDLSNVGMDIIAVGAHAPNGNYYGDYLRLIDNQVNYNRLDSLGSDVKIASGEHVVTLGNLIQYIGTNALNYFLQFPTVPNNQIATFPNKGGHVAMAEYQFNTQTGAVYTFVIQDANDGVMVEGNRGTAQTFTIPPHSSVAYVSGAAISIVQRGAGKITFAPGAAVTIISKGSNLSIAAQGVAVSIVQSSTVDTWYLIGDLIA